MNTHSNNLKCVGLLLLLLSVQQVSAYYDPGVQRWINRDPLGNLGSLPVMPALIAPRVESKGKRMSNEELFNATIDINRNLYGAMRNNAVSFVDPYGLDPTFCPGMSIFQNLTPAQHVTAAKEAAPAALIIAVPEILGVAAAELAAARLAQAIATAGRLSSVRAKAQGAYWQAELAYWAARGEALLATAEGASVAAQAEQVEAAAASLARAYASMRQAERAEAAAKAAVTACGK